MCVYMNQNCRTLAYMTDTHTCKINTNRHRNTKIHTCMILHKHSNTHTYIILWQKRTNKLFYRQTLIHIQTENTRTQTNTHRDTYQCRHKTGHLIHIARTFSTPTPPLSQPTAPLPLLPKFLDFSLSSPFFQM